jgi:hypothetical protein
MIKKLAFLIRICAYRTRGFLGLRQNDIMPVINEYYRKSFKALDARDIAVILPHCLIADRCPARFSKSDGIVCRKCDLCGCGRIRESAETRGYQFYISPSVGFTKRLVTRKNLRGVIGVACDYEISRGIASEKISGNGVKIEGTRVKTQGIRLRAYDCVRNDVDWGKIEELIRGDAS